MVTYEAGTHFLPESWNGTVVTDAGPESELLLCCARTVMAPANAERLQAILRREIDWTYLVAQALRHGVMPLLYWHLNTVCPEAVPAAVLAELRTHFQANAQRNLFLTSALLKVVALLEAHDIPVVPYKGPVLAAAVYGNLALRQFLDLDILVQEQHAQKARELLLAQGYRPKSHTVGAKEADEFAYAFLDKDGQYVVEVHWRLAPGFFPFPLEMAGLWQRLETVPLAGADVRHVSPEYLLLILCVHGSRHHWQRLAWITDVAELIRRHPDLDWQWVMEAAGETGSERMVGMALHLVQDLLNVPLPAQVERKLDKDPASKSLAARAHEWLFARPDGLPGDLALYAFVCQMRERWSDKVRYLLYLLRYRLRPNENDRAMAPLPAALAFLYYLLRPFRLTRKYAVTLLKYLFSH